MGKKDKSVETSDNFSFTVKSGDLNFVFTGPKKASIGMIYDVVHRLLLEVTNIAQKATSDLAVKEPKNNTSVDNTRVDNTSVDNTSVEQSSVKKNS